MCQHQLIKTDNKNSVDDCVPPATEKLLIQATLNCQNNFYRFHLKKYTLSYYTKVTGVLIVGHGHSA